MPSRLINHFLWWKGPDFLMDQSFQIPTSDEIQPDVEIISLNASEIIFENVSILPKISPFYRLKRILAICLRFVNACRHKKRVFGPIFTNEMNCAELTILKIIQYESLAKEIKALKSNKHVHRTSRFIKLSPFIETDGLLRVGGRLRNANLPFASKHQILLPKSHFVTELIIIQSHLAHHRVGLKLTTSMVREKFWISGIRQEVS